MNEQTEQSEEEDIREDVDWVEEIDWYGKWLVNGNQRILVEDSKEFTTSKEEAEQPREPTQEAYLLEIDYRLSAIELGLGGK